MRSLILRYSGMITGLVTFLAKIDVSTGCKFIYNQPEVPEELHEFISRKRL